MPSKYQSKKDLVKERILNTLIPQWKDKLINGHEFLVDHKNLVADLRLHCGASEKQVCEVLELLVFTGELRESRIVALGSKHIKEAHETIPENKSLTPQEAEQVLDSYRGEA